MLERLKRLNPELSIYGVDDSHFSVYGRVLEASFFTDYWDYLDQQTVMPEAGNRYVADDSFLRILVEERPVYAQVFGSMPLQFGHVNGYNSNLNALEYHKSHEIDLTLTPIVLLLGSVGDIVNGTYDISKLEAFLLPPRTAVELYASTLHFSPCKVRDEGFKCGVVLPKGTNTQFIRTVDFVNEEAKLLFKTNKWLIAHPDNKTLLELGAHSGLVGDNIKINY